MGRFASIPRFLFGVSPDLTSSARLDFPDAGARRDGFDAIGRVVVMGYHRALELADSAEIEASLAAEIEPALLSFAIEGAAMGFMVLDTATPWKRIDHVRQFLRHT